MYELHRDGTAHIHLCVGARIAGRVIGQMQNDILVSISTRTCVAPLSISSAGRASPWQTPLSKYHAQILHLRSACSQIKSVLAHAVNAVGFSPYVCCADRASDEPRWEGFSPCNSCNNFSQSRAKMGRRLKFWMFH